MPRNVILVGFMGAGKSTVGRLLARRLGRCFVETDAMITAREGRSIPEIFTERGEPYFRRLEAEVLEALADKHGHVIATGGGFPCGPGVMDRLLELGTVVWLAADFDAAYARANRTGGPPDAGGPLGRGCRRALPDPAGVLPARPPVHRHEPPDDRRRGRPDRPPSPRAGARRRADGRCSGGSARADLPAGVGERREGDG